MRTLRARLLSGTTIGTALVWSASSLVLYAVVHASLWAEFDDSLGAKARSLAALMEQEHSELELEIDEDSLPEFRPSDHAEYYEFWLADDQVFARSASLRGRDLDRVSGPIDAPVYQSVNLPDGRPGRIAGITFVPRQEDRGTRHRRGGQEVTLVVGRETAGIERTLSRLRLLLVSVCATAILASVAVLVWSVGRGLRPVAHLAAQIADVGESDLAARIEPAGALGELMPIVVGLNDLLARLEAAFRREKTFTADVAHEMRTPLAGLRSQLEVALAKPREPDAYRQGMTECLSICEQMQQMVDNLLGLARADAQQLEVAREEVDLGELLEACWEPLARRARERRLQIDWELARACSLTTDRSKLEVVLHNILDNAVTYTDAGGRISIALFSDDGRIQLRVSNTGSAITQEQTGSVFDRFWRGDVARGAIGQHCGLGLSLCRKLVALLGGSISAASTMGGTFTISILLNRG